MEKAIITCALTGSPVGQAPAEVPLYTPEVILREAEAAVKAGAAVIRLNPLDEQGHATPDPTFLRRTMRQIQERLACLVEVSTVVSPQATLDERLKVLSVHPDIVAIPCGSANLGETVLVQPLEWLQTLAAAATDLGVVTNLVCRDLSHIYAARRLLDQGTVKGNHKFTLVLGGDGGLQSDLRTLLHLVDALPRGAHWTVAGIGPAGRLVISGALLMGGHPRVGFEDSTLLRSRVKAQSNADLVQMVAAVADAIGRDLATAEQARALLTAG